MNSSWDVVMEAYPGGRQSKESKKRVSTGAVLGDPTSVEEHCTSKACR